MRWLTLTLVLTLLGQPASADVIVFYEHANLETSASSRCPEDPVPEPDFQKHFVDAVVDTDTELISGMLSDCGAAATSAELIVTRTGSMIAGDFGASSALQDHGGGYASLNASLQVRVDAPVTFLLEAVGSTTNVDDPDAGGLEFSFSGGSIDWATNGVSDFDVVWEGVLQPGEIYTLTMNAASQRAARELGGGNYLFQNGTTTRAVTFALTLDQPIVDADETSIGRVKQRY
jgi:hypothetical protein